MLVPLEEKPDRFVYLNPAYIESVFNHTDGAAIYMAGATDPIVVMPTADEVYGLIMYYSNEWEVEEDE